MAPWQCDRDEQPHQLTELIHHCDAGSQYTSSRLAEHLDPAGIAATIGSVDDACDNALMESAIGLFKRADQTGATVEDVLPCRVRHREMGALVLPPSTPR